MNIIRVGSKSINQIVNEHPNEEILIEIKNTKGLSANELRRIAAQYPKVKISVLGGLDYTQKKKYDSDYYKSRTIYSPMELSEIIRFFESIERGIDIDWTDTQKAMYIYKKLCDYMVYSENDKARGIGAVLCRKAVCAGFAMILKEEYDRVGIEAYYQNKRRSHGWNIAKLDGEYRGLDLTWDCCKKSDNGCGFYYFGRDKDFYLDEYHNIDDEPEEKKYHIVPYSVEQLRNDLTVVSRPKIIELITSRKGNTSYSPEFTIRRNGRTVKYHTELKDGLLSLVTGDNWRNYKIFRRNDGTSFGLIKIEDKLKELHKFIILEQKDDKLKSSYIFSEAALVDYSSQYDNVIANGLLSSNRIKRKIEQFNGYVGYFGSDMGIYYDGRVEDELNIVDRR